ncbi:Polycystic kidney disease 1 like [Dirofilaria immitis]
MSSHVSYRDITATSIQIQNPISYTILATLTIAKVYTPTLQQPVKGLWIFMKRCVYAMKRVHRLNYLRGVVSYLKAVVTQPISLLDD